MPPIKPVKKFNSTITELYAICRVCWLSCLENIAAFTAFRTIYNPALVNAALAEIDAAEAMPNEDARDLIHETLHADLVAQGEICLTEWRKLRAYIKGSFAPEYYDMNLQAAGGNYYETAIRENWEDMQQMLVAGKQYRIDNNVALVTGGMPAGFAAVYDGQLVNFSPLYNEFKDAQQDAEEGTVARMNANNAIYEKTQAMNFDGQTIFSADPAKYDRFVFSRVKELVTVESGSETILGTVQNTVAPSSASNAGAVAVGTQKSG